jgi:hypothetical protein
MLKNKGDPYHKPLERVCDDMTFLHVERIPTSGRYQIIERCRCGHIRQVRSGGFITFVNAETALGLLKAA